MKTVTKTALANVRQNKGRNILCGIAIGLTTLLIFVILTLGVGSVAGYGVFLYAKAEHMFDVQVYQYPVIPAVILVLAVTVIQLILSYGIMRSFRKQSLIEQIRYSE